MAEVPKGRELSSPAAADPIAGSLGGMSLDDVRRAPAAQGGTAPVALSQHAVFRTFDGLEIDVAGHKDGATTLVTFTPRSTAKETEAEAQTLTAHVTGWEFEIPSYKYDGMFRPLEDLLKKPEPAAKGGKEAPSKGGAKAGPQTGAGKRPGGVPLQPQASPLVSPGPGQQ